MYNCTYSVCYPGSFVKTILFFLIDFFYIFAVQLARLESKLFS